MTEDSAHRPERHTRRRRSRRRSVASLTATALAAGAIVAPMIAAAPAAHAVEAIACSTVYAMNASDGAGSTLWSVDVATGEQTVVGTIDPGADSRSHFNGLGVVRTPEHPDGVAHALRADTWLPGGVGAFASFDFATGTTRTVDVAGIPTGFSSVQTHGGTDPHTGLYFHGSANGGRLHLEARNTATGVVEGLLSIGFTGTPLPGTNGDLAFDGDGNMYIVLSSESNAVIYLLEAREVGRHSPDSAPRVSATTIQSFLVDDVVNGIAFDSAGYLVVSTATELLRVNPMSGAVANAVTFAEPGVVDIASCAYPSHLTLQKEFPHGRDSAHDDDQVRLSVSGGGLVDLHTDTTGSSSGIQTEQVTIPVLGGTEVTLQETGAGADQTRYASSWTCTDETGAVLASGQGTSGTITAPERGPDGARLTCVFTNTPISGAAVGLTKTVDNTSPQAGDEITYSFEVVNTGIVPLYDVHVEEVEFTGAGDIPTVICPGAPLSLDVGAAATCTATYIVTQADVDRGKIDNTATASGLGFSLSGDRVTSPPSTAQVTPPSSPALHLVKSTDTTVFREGSSLLYSFLVTNVGTTSITDVRVDEVQFSGAGTLPTPTCPAEAVSLAPGESITCTTTYQVVEGDLDATSIDNTALAVGESAGEPVESNPSSTSTPRGETDVTPEETLPPSTAPQIAPPVETGAALADTGSDLVPSLVAGGAALLLLTIGLTLVIARRSAGTLDA